MAILCISSCSEKNTAAINALLDARDTAISAHDIEAYGALLLRDYLDDTGQQANDVINKMNRLFAQFEATEMISNHRIIRLLDDQHAECEQSYLLRVKADDTWRQLNQRERIFLTKTSTGWKISSGL